MRSFVAEEPFSLGAGSFGTCVYVGLMEDGSEVAVKRMLIQACKSTAENEKKILTLVDAKKSPFVVSYRHFFKDSTFMYLVLDLCEETMYDYVHSCSLEYLQKHGKIMIKEILTGLMFLHSQRILHRDLKPQNILVDIDCHMKLSDFGISRVMNENETRVLTVASGTQGWMAAEVIDIISKGGKGDYRRKSDVQVAGMLAHFILTKGEHPFGSFHDRMTNILKANPVNLKNLDDLAAREFVQTLISHNISDRPHAHEALEHFYFKKELVLEASTNKQDENVDAGKGYSFDQDMFDPPTDYKDADPDDDDYYPTSEDEHFNGEEEYDGLDNLFSDPFHNEWNRGYDDEYSSPDDGEDDYCDIEEDDDDDESDEMEYSGIDYVL